MVTSLFTIIFDPLTQHQSFSPLASCSKLWRCGLVIGAYFISGHLWEIECYLHLKKIKSYFKFTAKYYLWSNIPRVILERGRGIKIIIPVISLVHLEFFEYSIYLPKRILIKKKRNDCWNTSGSPVFIDRGVTLIIPDFFLKCLV